jgi:N6-L-threonylcarbamoyladenine synthase
MIRILGIETSCDETSAAVVEDGRTILSNVIASQIELHARYGGVFPEVASRAHVEAIVPTVERALADAHVSLGDVDAIAVTRGPGLAGSLLVGVNLAKGLALGRGLPLLGINHLESHLYSVWLIEGRQEPKFPVLTLIVSGGHTDLILMTGHGQYQRLGGTIDDAAGEAFDKVGRLLGLPYPGGPSVEKAAVNGNPKAYRFTRARTDNADDFSFSGIKTAVLRIVQDLGVDPEATPEQKQKLLPVANLAASFQAAVVETLVDKTVAAAEQHAASEIFVVGGVSANQALRARMAARADVPVRVPPLVLCTDNAAMVAACGFYRYLAGQRDGFDLDVLPNLKLA